ncbi:C40 family peptidase [Pseudoalteromonas phenolica]|uniref:Permuted papain-like amidase YaeF/Yiix C92 family enzyme n=2 Tax=Pseudoalteromonas phenolica TaxID=161398 RepID=A0A0S2K3W0_9GAMM|nr:hypothetical protein [Pseudoalteromonas phenolica]ALO42756.1 hypothetical protein PP2015_2259 [Pseudoalteromonas phenolica]MBE0356134.1 hypothetical protein [Pseudoalteromonas phenolica O-BC30]
MLNSIIYPYIKRKKDSLKRRVDIRGDKIWMGPKPKPIDQSDLVIGDVLFCGSAESDKATTLIQNMTDGAYVHCGVYIGNGIVADIATSGARKIKFESFYENYSYLAIGRCPGISPPRQRAIIRYANLCIKNSVKYNWIGAILLPFYEYSYVKSQYRIALGKKYKEPTTYKKRLTKSRLFCSEFVVQCFKSCGYIMKSDPYSISHVCSPTWLAEENTFQLIGYMSSNGLLNVDDSDPFLGGCSYVLEKT